RPCEEMYCRDFKGSGVDLVAGCYEDPDPAVVQKCVDIMACVRRTGCGRIDGIWAEPCYCGTATSLDCQLAKGVNGPCKAEFEAAAGSADPVYITGKFSVRQGPTRAMANAVLLVQCDAQYCPDTCTPHP
ncbi:MAG TPA: hypothetical protein VF331_23580, partial [Polyangiales bacterium]